MEGRPRVGVRFPCRSRGADSLPQHEGGAAGFGGRPPVLSMELVFLGRLVLVMHSTLIGYAIGYLPNQDPPGYPGLLI